LIATVWPYLAVMLLAAGIFPSLERAYAWRVFQVLPPIVFTYLFVTALAVAGVWTASDEIREAQRASTSLLLPTLLFLLMVTCDLRAILALGPRLLAVFACAMLSILVAMMVVYAIFRSALPADGWQMMAALSATWTGGSANLVAVKQMIGLSESALPAVLLADALCYSVWVVLLFSSAGFATRFDRWTGADQRQQVIVAAPPATVAADASSVLLWLGIALVVSLGAAWLAAEMPTATMFTSTSWTVLFATISGLVVARTPLARLPGAGAIAGALLACLVAVLASQSNFAGLAAAPLFVLCGFLVLLLHVALLAGAAKLFRFELHLCGIASLAQIGGAASAPLLAATYSRVLVPVAVLMAMLGLVLGTGIGMMMASVLSAMAP
jgi:uncharacterized membrane protein